VTGPGSREQFRWYRRPAHTMWGVRFIQIAVFAIAGGLLIVGFVVVP